MVAFFLDFLSNVVLKLEQRVLIHWNNSINTFRLKVLLKIQPVLKIWKTPVVLI